MGYTELKGKNLDVFTGARAGLKVKGYTVGYATDCDASEEIAYEPVRAIDQLEVVEFVPVAYSVAFSAGYVRLLQHSLKKLGLFPGHSGTPEEFIKGVLTKLDFTVTLVDSVTTAGFMTLHNARISSHRWRVQAGSVVSEDVDFVGIRMTDESSA